MYYKKSYYERSLGAYGLLFYALSSRLLVLPSLFQARGLALVLS